MGFVSLRARVCTNSHGRKWQKACTENEIWTPTTLTLRRQSVEEGGDDNREDDRAYLWSPKSVPHTDSTDPEPHAKPREDHVQPYRCPLLLEVEPLGPTERAEPKQP